uniref:Large ribosomal subunit protein bL21c n=1 Tax=Rhizochromulina marina TaxID=1034831 RepID=A0A514CQ06_9STRA|nr:ribosomal protein L21 [Rhizochromulina marina]QDH81893.1 ribosomal protein L21 [Rhizochromulina marina]
MHYAIVEIGGRQIWVENGNYFFTDRLSIPPGTNVSLTRVLLANMDGKLHLGHPYLKTGAVVGEVLEHVQGPKLISYKMKSKKKYKRKQGHRQLLTKLLIKNITI